MYPPLGLRNPGSLGEPPDRVSTGQSSVYLKRDSDVFVRPKEELPGVLPLRTIQ